MIQYVMRLRNDKRKQKLWHVKSDIMLVIGGRASSNTKKLYEISKKCCPETFFVENFEDIPQGIFIKNKKIGITAGASTPGGIIEEVFTTMDEKMKNEEIFCGIAGAVRKQDSEQRRHY